MPPRGGERKEFLGGGGPAQLTCNAKDSLLATSMTGNTRETAVRHAQRFEDPPAWEMPEAHFQRGEKTKK